MSALCFQRPGIGVELIGTLRICRLPAAFSLAHAKPPHFEVSLLPSGYAREGHQAAGCRFRIDVWAESQKSFHGSTFCSFRERVEVEVAEGKDWQRMRKY